MLCPFGESSDRSIMDALGFDLEGCTQEFLPTFLYRIRTELITDTENYNLCDAEFDYYPLSLLFPFLKQGQSIPKSFYLIDYFQVFSAFGLYPSHLVSVAVYEAAERMIYERTTDAQIVSPSFLEAYNSFVYSFSDPLPEEAITSRKVSAKIPLFLAGKILSFHELTKTPTDYFINYSISLIAERLFNISADGNFSIYFNNIINMRLSSMWLFSSANCVSDASSNGKSDQEDQEKE